MPSNLLPDCRAQSSRRINRGMAGTWIPVYCANCGADGGQIPEQNMTFLFYLCNACAETYGQIAGTLQMPDEVFFQQLADEQMARYGRHLSPTEWAIVSEDPTHPLTRLLRERPALGVLLGG
jgi:hypothetical protein